jgi:hemolysin activation/secretion protein
MKAAVSTCLLSAVLASCLFAQAAEPGSPGSVLPERPSARRPELPEFLPAKPGSGLSPPPVLEGERLSVDSGGSSFKLQGVVFEDNTVFSDQKLDAIAKDFVGKKVTLAELEELRYRLTRHYTDHGYINSGVVLKPGQVVDDGVVIYQVWEGRLDEVRVNGTGRLRPDYVRDRVWPDPESPFNIQFLQERFQLLLRDPLIERLNGELLPGTEPGSATLDLEVTRSRPYELSFGVDNHRPPSTGAVQVYAASVLRNLSGYGDALDLWIGFSNGDKEVFSGYAVDEIFAGYSIPITAHDSRFFLRFGRSDRAVVEQPLEDLDIESETLSWELGLLHPVHRSLRRTVTLGIALARRENQTFLLGVPFPFSPGAEDDGESRVTVLRLSQELLDRTAEHALALRSTLSFGIDAFGTTVHNQDLPDSQFFAWLGQAQYARRLGEWGALLILRGDVQLANDKLLDLERFAVGGVRTVRGYRENELVRDNGYAVSTEFRYPVWKGGKKSLLGNLLQIAAFTDFGTAWNKGERKHRDYLFSVGLGLLWSPLPQIYTELYLAHAIEEVKPKDEHNLQDDGVHFRFNVTL